MKRFPECRRDYYDDSFLSCPGDGTAHLEAYRYDENLT
jgi:hypothetical protein